MRRARAALLTAAAMGGLAGAATAAQAAAPEASVSDRLQDRRFTVIGHRAYEVGFEDGRYRAQGWHIRGEMGGFWTAPLKLLDGLWLGIDGEWIGPATRFTSGSGFVGMALPTTQGIELERTDFVPDGRRAILVGLTLRSPGAQRTVTVDVEARSELLSAYPWQWTTPSAVDFHLPDEGDFDGQALVFTETGTPTEASGAPLPNVEAHDWAALVGASTTPVAGETGDGHWGPQAGVVCDTAAWTDPCDDSSNGKGTGGRLAYELTIPAGGERTLWLAVAGSDTGLAAARTELERALRDPAGALAAKKSARTELAARTRLSLPGHPDLVRGIEWSKQNLADSVQEATNLRIRDVDEGKAYPAPIATLDRARWLGAGWPDYPWLFGTDGEYTAFASVGVGQFEPIMDHLRALRDVSLIANGDSGKVVHEVVHDGSIYFGTNRHDGNTDETSKFPTAVALLWRWTGSRGWLEEMYPFAKANMEHVFRDFDADGDFWPEGRGNVERAGMGPEKLDNTVYTARGLRDLADMARAMGDAATVAWADTRARSMERRFESAWWMADVPQVADSLAEDGTKQLRRHWIGATPMEYERVDERGDTVPGLLRRPLGLAALTVRESSCYSSDWGMFHTGQPGCDNGPDAPAELGIYTLNTAILALAEGNYGRAAQQRRHTQANVRAQLEPLEQPGAMPEIVPSPGYTEDVLARPLTERAMVLQAWGALGTVWPVVHQQLGIRPDLGRGRLEVVPQLPSAAPIAGRAIRLGDGRIEVRADRTPAGRYRTIVDARDADAVRDLRIGHTLPRGTAIRLVTLDDARAEDVRVRTTNRGVEVTVRTGPGRHVLAITPAT
jgi:hypothetical protein